MTKKKNKGDLTKNCKNKPLGSGTVSDNRRALFQKRAMTREHGMMEKEDKQIDWEKDKKWTRNTSCYLRSR